MDRNDAIGMLMITAVACILTALLSSTLTSYAWGNGCARLCEPFAMDANKTYKYRVCQCMSEDE